MSSDQLRLVVIEPGEMGVEVRPVELSRIPFVVKDLVLTQAGGQSFRDLLHARPVLFRERQPDPKAVRFSRVSHLISGSHVSTKGVQLTGLAIPATVTCTSPWE